MDRKSTVAWAGLVVAGLTLTGCNSSAPVREGPPGMIGANNAQPAGWNNQRQPSTNAFASSGQPNMNAFAPGAANAPRTGLPTTQPTGLASTNTLPTLNGGPAMNSNPGGVQPASFNQSAPANATGQWGTPNSGTPVGRAPASTNWAQPGPATGPMTFAGNSQPASAPAWPNTSNPSTAASTSPKPVWPADTMTGSPAAAVGAAPQEPPAVAPAGNGSTYQQTRYPSMPNVQMVPGGRE